MRDAREGERGIANMHDLAIRLHIDLPHVPVRYMLDEVVSYGK